MKAIVIGKDDGGIDVIQTTATFVDGVFRPDVPIDLPENQRVRLFVELLLSEKSHEEALKDLEEVWRTSTFASTESHLTRDQLHERR